MLCLKTKMQFCKALLATFMIGTCYATNSSIEFNHEKNHMSTAASQSNIPELTATFPDELTISAKYSNQTLTTINMDETESPTSMLPLKVVTTDANIQDRFGEFLTLQQLDIFKRISAGSQTFALELFSKFSNYITPIGRDFMISPFSVWSLLLLIAEGASGNSLAQLKTTLHLNDDTHLLRTAYHTIQNTLQVNTSTVEVAVLQALFTDLNQPVSREFEDVLEQSYHADLIAVDFHNPLKAADKINSEVQRATNGLIKNAIQSTDLSDSQMVLLSTLFFKGQWKWPFNKELTDRRPFHDETGKVIGVVDMMFHIGNFKYTAMKDLEGHVLELPYGKEDRLSMLIILPRMGVSLTKIVENLKIIGTMSIFEKLRSFSKGFENEDVEVNIPRFTASSSFIVNGVLHEMGIQDIFDPRFANLTKISPSVFVSKLFHMTKIVVNEEGTIASAATTATLDNKAQPPKFNLDRPFVFMIMEKTTNSLLFCGQVMNPTIAH